LIVAAHQPNYLPYIGFFNKMKNADVFIIYDDAQFSRKDFHHRNKIRTPNGWRWLSVPVEKEEIPINEVRIKNNAKIGGMKWSKYHWLQIHSNYVRAEFFSRYAGDLEKIYSTSYERIIDLNMSVIRFLMSSFGIETEIVNSSTFGITTHSSQKIIDMVNAVHGDTYLSGSGGHNYMDNSLFEKQGIKVNFQNFQHPVYKQRFPGFIPNMSAIDLLLNVGEKAQNLV
jgi:hypothetical protein